MEKTGLVMGMQREQWKTVIVVVGVTGGMYIGIKYILHLCSPFLCISGSISVKTACQEHPCTYKLNQGAVAGGLLLIILGVVGTALWFLGSTLVQQFCYFIEHYGFYAGKMELFLDQCCRSMSGSFRNGGGRTGVTFL